jgi:hypothetical protein
LTCILVQKIIWKVLATTLRNTAKLMFVCTSRNYRTHEVDAKPNWSIAFFLFLFFFLLDPWIFFGTWLLIKLYFFVSLFPWFSIYCDLFLICSNVKLKIDFIKYNFWLLLENIERWMAKINIKKSFFSFKAWKIQFGPSNFNSSIFYPSFFLLSYFNLKL